MFLHSATCYRAFFGQTEIEKKIHSHPLLTAVVVLEVHSTSSRRAFFDPTEIEFVTDLGNRTLSRKSERPDQSSSDTHLLSK